jgi:peptidoglycan/LPS O-acetylase OafA/YrhL
LGLPSLLFMLVIQPFMVFVLLGHPHVADRPSLPTLYGRYIASGAVLSGNGPMWFALALLCFCAVLAGVCALKPAGGASASSSPGPPGGAALLGFGVGLVLSTFLVRLWQSFGTNVLNFQLCFFPQYIAAFVVGVVAARRGWLEALVTSRRARVAGWLGCFGGPLLLAAVVGLGGPPPESGPMAYAGGWNLRALAYASWEQLTGLGIALGLLAWFRSSVNASGRMSTWLSERSFAVYLLHAPVLVALTPWLRPVINNPFVGVGLLTFTGLIASYLLADGARRLPGLRRIL